MAMGGSIISAVIPLSQGGWLWPQQWLHRKFANPDSGKRTTIRSREHRHEYIGQWIVLDGDRLVGSGHDPRPIVAQARAEGVIAPFVELVRDTSKPFMGGWL